MAKTFTAIAHNEEEATGNVQKMTLMEMKKYVKICYHICRTLDTASLTGDASLRGDLL
jgi:hypothetical protein